MKKGLLLLAVLALSACTDPDNASRVLADNGFTNIKIGGYSWTGCGREDNYATEFSATAPTGKQVHGVVCAGIWKGSTIRFE
ncbi:hypothetical protein SIO53_001266 [Enterobacter roggenkampii]|nr:hypothetical protein [Enterobacter roggenkampii]